MANLPEHVGGSAEQLVRLRECCKTIWSDHGRDRVKKEVALLLLAKAAKQSYQLRLHVVGHMLNVHIGKDWKKKYGVENIPMAQLMQSEPFLVVPTDVPNVDAVRLDIERLASMPGACCDAAEPGGSVATSSKVRVVPRLATIPSASTSSPRVPAGSGNSSSRISSNSRPVFSPAAGTVKGVAVLAYINSMRWHEQQQINMLRQALASNIVRKAIGVDGTVSAATDNQQFRVTVGHAADVIERSWHGRYPADSNPYSSLQELLADDPLLQLLPTLEAASKGSNGSEQQVELNIQLLLERMTSKAGSPAAPLTPAPAGGKPLLSTAASPNAAAEAAAAKLMGLLTGKACKPAGGAVFSRALAASLPSPATAAGASAKPAANASSAHGAAAHQHPQQHQQQKPETRVHKRLLLNFIQQRHWDHDVEFNLMKRAVATFMVNKAADGQQECPVKLVTVHVAKAGEVIHKVWTGRHGAAEKPYKKVADVLGSDQYFTIEDGPNHARQLVQLDIPAIVAAVYSSVDVSTKAALSTGPVAGPTAVEQVQSSTAAGDAIMQEILQEDAEELSSPVAAGQVAGHGAAGRLLALDLLAFASLVSWHESHAGLSLLRQQLACMIIEGAHPGLAEASVAGQPLVASTEDARYSMSPYSAGSALMAIWKAHHPDQPRPYTTLPSALEGCRYLQLRLSIGGYKVQLDVQQYLQNCKAAMQQMGSKWQALVDISASQLASKGSPGGASPAVSDVIAAPSAVAAVADSVTAASDDGIQGMQQALQLHLPAETSIGTADRTAASPSLAGSSVAGRRSSSGSGLSGTGHAMSRSTLAGQGAAVLQPLVPNMQQLLNLLSYAPPGVCQHAAVVWVSEAAQQHIFGHSYVENYAHHRDAAESAASDVPASSAKDAGYDGGYESYGIQKLQGPAGVKRMLDHLLASPVVAVGCCMTPVHAANPNSHAPAALKQQQVLLQLLVPPVVGQDSSSALEAAVYVLEVPRKRLQDGRAGAWDQLSVLLKVLLEDARVVKLVDGLHMLPLLQQQYGINMAGVLDVQLLDGILASTELPEDLTLAAVDVGGLEAFIAAKHLTTRQLEGSKNILRSLMLRGCPEGKPIPAELISTAASTVRPLMPLALSILQLLPMALMRRCSIAATMPVSTAAVAPVERPATSAPLDVQPKQHQVLPLQGRFDLGVNAFGKERQQQPMGWSGGAPAVA